MNFNQILKSSKVSTLLKYSSIKYVALIIGFVKGIVNARALGPELLGLLGNLLLILSYLSYSNLGLLYSMNREFVIYESKNDLEGSKNVISTSFTFLFVLFFVLILTGIGAKFIYNGNLGYYILIVFIIAILEQYRLFYTTYFRLVNNFKGINHIELINNLVSFILIIITIKYLGIYSVLIAMFIADFIVFIYGYKNSENIKLNIDKKVLKNLIIIGFPLLVYNLGYYILTTIDRVMTIKFLGYEDLGYYTFSTQIVSGTLVFITSILFLYYPKAIKYLNTDINKDKKEIYTRMEKYTKYLEMLGVILCLFGAILINPFVNIVAPNYYISINIYRILVFGMIINQMAYFSNIFIVSNKRQIYLIYLQAIVAVLAVVLNFIFIKLGLGIIGISIAALIANIIYSIMQHKIYLKLLDYENIHRKNIIKVYSKFILYIFICIILSLINIGSIVYSISISIITLVLYYKDFKDKIKSMVKV